MRLPYLLIFSVVIAGCQNIPGYTYPSGPVPQPELTSVSLNSPLRIRADYASVYIQSGKKRATNSAGEYYPHCILELRTISSEERTVQPDQFRIIRIRRDRFMTFINGQLLAASGGDYNPVMSSTELFLQSDRQPDVYRLTCQQLDEPFRAHHLTVEEMQNALGDIMTLH